MSTPKYKILKSFYCYHPEIIFDGNLRPAFWGVEWTVAIKNNPQPTIYEHYMRKVDTETEVQKLLAELLQECGEFAPWQAWDNRCWYLNPKYKISVLDRKKRAIFRGNHSVYQENFQ